MSKKKQSLDRVTITMTPEIASKVNAIRGKVIIKAGVNLSFSKMIHMLLDYSLSSTEASEWAKTIGAELKK